MEKRLHKLETLIIGSSQQTVIYIIELENQLLKNNAIISSLTIQLIPKSQDKTICSCRQQFVVAVNNCSGRQQFVVAVSNL